MERDGSINHFKAFLVIGMIFAHCVQLLTDADGYWELLSQAINLITFSGFFFVFGYVYNISYCDSDVAFGKKFRSVLLPLLGFYVSAISWCVIVDDSLSFATILKILLLLKISPYSEFLLAYAVMSLLFWLLRPLLVAIRDNAPLVIAFVILLLALSCIPFYRLYPTVQYHGEAVYFDYYIGLMFGSDKAAYFPVFQYFIFFLLGIFFNRKQIGRNPVVFLVSFLGTLAFVMYCLIVREYPSRFPPSVFWIAGSWFILYVYYLGAKRIGKSAFLANIGENTLSYLLLSNILIFSMIRPGKYSYLAASFAGVAILFIIYFLIYIVRKPAKQT